MATVAGDILGEGSGFTVTNREAVAVQLLLSVTVTVYVVEVVGTKIADVPEPPLLLQAKEVPPLAESIALAPIQMETEEGVMAALGIGFTVTKREAEAVQALAPITVTVYVVDVVGEKVAAALEPPVLLQA